jgi:hypothetical protein
MPAAEDRVPARGGRKRVTDAGTARASLHAAGER